jgi:hypothetical protein
MTAKVPLGRKDEVMVFSLLQKSNILLVGQRYDDVDIAPMPSSMAGAHLDP